MSATTSSLYETSAASAWRVGPLPVSSPSSTPRDDPLLAAHPALGAASEPGHGGSADTKRHADPRQGEGGTFRLPHRSTQTAPRHVRCLLCNQVPRVPVQFQIDSVKCRCGPALFCESCLREELNLNARRGVPNRASCGMCQGDIVIPWYSHPGKVYTFDEQMAKALDDQFPDPVPCTWDGCDHTCSRLEMYHHVHTPHQPWARTGAACDAAAEHGGELQDGATVERVIEIYPTQLADSPPATFSGAERISSWSWLPDCPQPTLAVPGEPPRFTGLPVNNITVSRDNPDDGKGAVPTGTLPLTPLALSLPAAIDLSCVHFILTRHVLLKLLMSITCQLEPPALRVGCLQPCRFYLQGRCTKVPCTYPHTTGGRRFQFDADITARGALVLANSEDHEKAVGAAQGFTHSLARQLTDPPQVSGQRAAAFHRVRRVRLGGCSMIVSCSVDAVEAADSAAGPQADGPAPPDAHPGAAPGHGVNVVQRPHGGTEWPDLDFKTRHGRHTQDMRWLDVYLQMLIGGTDRVVWGFHSCGSGADSPGRNHKEFSRFEEMTLNDVEQKVDLPATEKRLGGLALLLQRIREAVTELGGSASVDFDPETAVISVRAGRKGVPRLPPEWGRWQHPTKAE
eukprot:TRINITY_DN28927_c0_g1_i1.p1 TRINITY_DN28927_c0_g1~~TRINITY_DN28927_c0_g1_i1.p1  ORF type:complete len:649 (+),score=142.71 TRINITY_DN28927_c0_g1_i1:72-1949(+)